MSAEPEAGTVKGAYQVADIVGNFEFAERSSALGVDNSLGDTLTIEMGQKID